MSEPNNTTALGTLGPSSAVVTSAPQPDWSESDTSSPAFIKNKPDLKTVATTGSYNDLSDKPAIPAAVAVDSALSGTSANPVQNKVVTAALNGKATSAQGAKADAALSRAEAVAGFTEWVCVPATWDGHPISIVEDSFGSLVPFANGVVIGTDDDALTPASVLPTSLTWTGDNKWEGSPQTLTATRTRLPTMADIPTDNAQLTNGAGYATTTEMNAALAGKADASSLPYALANATQDGYTAWAYDGLPEGATDVYIGWIENDNSWMFSFTSGGVEYFSHNDVGVGLSDISIEFTCNPVSGSGDAITVTATRSPKYVMLDRTMNQLAFTSQTLPSTGIALSFPAAHTGKVRDFLVRLTIPAGDAPQIAYPSDVKFGNGAGEFPEINTTDTTGATAETILMFTETAPYVANATPAKFFVKGEAWNEIGGAQ